MLCPLLKFTGRQELKEVDKQGSRDPKLKVARHPHPGGWGVGSCGKGFPEHVVCEVGVRGEVHFSSANVQGAFLEACGHGTTEARACRFLWLVGIMSISGCGIAEEGAGLLPASFGPGFLEEAAFQKELECWPEGYGWHLTACAQTVGRHDQETQPQKMVH